MAHSISLRRPLPLFKALRISPTHPQKRQQCFSQSSILQHPDRKSPGLMMPRQAPEPSQRVVIKEQQRLQQIMPSDFGLLDHTFITPTSNAPRLFSAPKAFWKFRCEQFKSRLRDRFSLLIVWMSSPSRKRIWDRAIKIERKKITPTAVALHRRMYTKFAEGDTVALRGMCTDGIFDTFQTRISNRQPGEKVVWELLRYNGAAKLISHKGVAIPVEGATIRQAVVRISSRQKLTRWVKGKGGKMTMVEGSGKEKDVEEFLVVQRMTKDWKEGEWLVWGTTRETTMMDVLEWERKRQVSE